MNGKGTVPVNGKGTGPVNGKGTVPVNGKGTAPVTGNGDGSFPVHAEARTTFSSGSPASRCSSWRRSSAATLG